MRGDRTVHVLREGERDWQGDPVGPATRVLVATDCAFIPKINRDDGSLVAGEAQLVVFPGAENIPEPEDSLEIAGAGDKPWQIDGDVAHFTKGGATKAWIMNVRTQR